MKKMLLVLTLLLLCCSNSIYRTVYPLLSDGKYDSEFPYRNSSQEIKAISETTVKIYSTTQYKIYYFDRSDRMTHEDIKELLLVKCNSVTFGENPVSGSSIVISSNSQAVLLLTCSHVVFHGDSIFTYYKEDGNSVRYIRTLAIKTRERLMAAGFPEDGVVQLLAHDKEADIALLGKIWRQPPEKYIPEFTYPMGKSRELEWGSFVYMIGYPQGQQMVTKAIVSQPNRDGKGAFLLDGNFNRGFSGGVVLGIRDGVPNFEMVGMAYSTSGAPEAILTPSPDAEYDMQVPYDGNLYVSSVNRINYGITFVTSAEVIVDFLKEQKNKIKGSEYELGLCSFLNKLEKKLP
jgi:hypothetical protein